ncbi:DUF2268 domain-containing protein [Lysinibacillus sp. 54212]|uniref:DUF2268 domain-containing protein n=1 Tax=Lysinibacillus sp. 54212 TaxID=3119829 RepID=UPI002FC91514
MTVIRTEKLLLDISELCKFQSAVKIAAIHREILCKPLKSLFPHASLEAIHYELIRNGLITPNECEDLNSRVKELEEKNVWEIVQREYERLKVLWKGPEISIYIYPLTKNRLKIDNIVPIKNGIAYRNALFLFVSTELDVMELKALVAHEYHHICRLHIFNLSLEKVTLQDTLVLEGMAEYAVEEMYGDQFLSPWTKRYSLAESLIMWEEKFVGARFVTGINNHRIFLYGNEGEGFPNWIGYCIGYHIVHSFQQNYGKLDTLQLLNRQTDVILAHSNFLIKD